MHFEDEHERLARVRELPQRLRILLSSLERAPMHEFICGYMEKLDREEIERRKSDPDLPICFSRIGRLQIMTIQSQTLFSLPVNYVTYRNFILAQRACCPLDPLKDTRFDTVTLLKKNPSSGIPCRMIISTNGSDSAALKKLRKKISKK